MLSFTERRGKKMTKATLSRQLEITRLCGNWLKIFWRTASKPQFQFACGKSWKRSKIWRTSTTTDQNFPFQCPTLLEKGLWTNPPSPAESKKPSHEAISKMTRR